MTWFLPVLFLELVAMFGMLLSHDDDITWQSAQGGSRTRIRVVVVLPDARRRTGTEPEWPFSIQKVSPAVDAAIRRVNTKRIVFDVR